MNSHLDMEKDHDLLNQVDFLKQSWKFVPKHLLPLRNQQNKGHAANIQRKLKDKDSLYQLSTLQIINQNKNLYLTPVRDLQKIMKHFKRKFQDTNLNPIQEQIKPKKGKKKSRPIRQRTQNDEKTQNKSRRLKSNMDIGQKYGQQLIEHKITRLLQLPTIKRANSQAQRIKMINMQQSTKKSFEKQQILRKFEQYFTKQTDIINKNNSNIKQINPEVRQQNNKKLRIKTSMN